MTEYGLSRDLKCSKEEAIRKRNAYFRYHRGVPHWMEDVKKEALARGYAITMIGRKRYFPQPPEEFESKFAEKMWWANLERQAMNTPIQGTAADIMKMALVENWKRVRDIALQTNVVHDELLEEAPDDVAEYVAEITNGAMVEAAGRVLKHCPVLVDVNVGTNWGEKK